MTIPPKGDPRRPVALAVRLMRLLGIIHLVLAGITVLPLFLVRRGFGPPVWARMVVVMVPLLPAVGYLLSAIFVRRRQAWGIVLGIVVASVSALFLLSTMIGVV